MSVAICILAKDEERTIARALSQLAEQSLLRSALPIEIHVVSNGSTDATVAQASGMEDVLATVSARLHVHDLKQPGKSRAWNKAVHNLLGNHIDVVFFLDADVELLSARVLEQLLQGLADHPEAQVISGHPVKDISRKSRKSPLDRFSLLISRASRHDGAINGSLYVARMKALREIWLPNETPGEDGFLNAMVTTRGFTRQPDARTVITAEAPTHSFTAHDARNFFGHERRMIVGTVINCWIFEHLWALNSQEPVGERIRYWNDDEPYWVEHLIRDRVGERRWLVPNSILFGRFSQSRSGVLRRLAYLPAGIAATLLTIPPAMMANKRLKDRNAASTW